MPRIPVRTEPYASPSRQHRHFKNKRDQVLRALGKAAYINGSHFAIMWVTASGQAETYASDAFQERLEDWFDKAGIKEEGIRLVLERNGKVGKSDSTSSSRLDRDDAAGDDAAGGAGSGDSDDGGEDEDDDDDDGALTATGSRSAGPSTMNNTPMIACEDVFGPVPSSSSPSVSGSSNSLLAPNNGLAASRLNRKPLALLDTNSTNQQFSAQLLAVPGSAGDDEKYMRAPMSAPLPNSDAQKSLMRPPMLCRTGSHAAPGSKLTQVTLPNVAARTAFFELRFGQMQQGMCKTVAKAWIKIIEPKKQTRCPYNKGEEGKPEWWPEGVRHKEPDHLMKPERHALLLTILRSPKIKVARLQLATAEVVAMIRADKVNLLMDVYRIAREEERLRQSREETADNEPISVGVSTLDGWKAGGANGEQGGLDEEGKRATLGEDTPESEEKSTRQRADRASKKRSFQAMARSMSSSATDKRPRSSIGTVNEAGVDGAMGPNPGKRLSVSGNVAMQRSVSHHQLGLERTNSFAESQSPVSFPMGQGWAHATPNASMPLSEDASMRRSTSTSAAASAAVAAASLSYGASGHRGNAVGYDQYTGNQTPSFMLNGSPQFVQQAFAPDQRFQQQQQPGSMSAPQGPHAQLYPAVSASHASSSASTSPALNYNYQYNAQFIAENPFDQSNHAGSSQQAQQSPANMFSSSMVDLSNGGAGALGLHGLPTDVSGWANFDPTFMQWAASPSQTQHQGNQAALPFNSAPARIVALPPTVGDDSMTTSAGDLSAGDLSFASSAGPATPPHLSNDTQLQQLHHQQRMQQQQQQQKSSQQQVHNQGLLNQMYGSAPRGQAGNFDAWVTGA